LETGGRVKGREEIVRKEWGGERKREEEAWGIRDK
jgi:hypothetical protein